MTTQHHYSHLSQPERHELFFHLKKGYSLREIASMMDRSHSTLVRELKRNSTKRGYDPPAAKQKAYVRRKNSKYQGMKLESHSGLKSYVTDHLTRNWTPEMISGRLQFVDTHLPYISAKGIYHWLYSSWGQAYCQYLTHEQHAPRKRSRQGKKKQRTMIPDRVGIELRPLIINARKRAGDWEVDTIVSGKKTVSKVALCVIVDRKTRYTKIRKIPNLKPDTLNRAVQLSLHALPCYSLTYDNGIENKKHTTLRDWLHCTTYFCHPFHSWEKGTNENTNGRIRRFVTKGDDIGLYTDAEIQAIEDWLNTTPRKCLTYKTPLEVMQEEIQLQKQKERKKHKKSPLFFNHPDLKSGALEG